MKRFIADREKEIIFRSDRFRSLSMKTFVLIMAQVFIVGGAAFLIGLQLFNTVVSWEVRDDTYSLARTEDDLLNNKATKQKAAEILAIYDSIPEEEKGDGTSREYKANFEPVLDASFRGIQKDMYRTREQDQMRACFIAAVDKNDPKGRMIYLVDDDPNPKTFCMPGTWENYPQDKLDDLVYGAVPSEREVMMGLTQRIPAMWSDRRGSTICTASSAMFEIDQYIVFVCIDKNIEQMEAVSKKFVQLFGLLQLLISIGVALLAVYIIRKFIVHPINRMAGAASSYSTDKQRLDEGGFLMERHFEDLDIRTGDEIENLSLIMKEMEADIFEYVGNLTQMTAERERINTELDLASRLQVGALPSDFPAFPDREEFQLYATMSPAKEVGGDFYDFFLLDEDHLAVVIADVSGKGMPGALFMMAAKISINDYTMTDDSRDPGEILRMINERVCASNPMEMFITVWLGILELSTGHLVAANAGHEYPAIRHDGSFALYKDSHGLVIGGMEGMAYRTYELELEPEDAIFLYTDGVTESTDASNQLFGTDRMLDALNRDPMQGPEQLIANVTEDIAAFVKEEEQFDDTTMFCLVYHGPESKEDGE